MKDKELIELWRGAVRDSGSTNPFNRSVLNVLGEHGVTMVDIRTRIGHLLSKGVTKCTEDEKRLLNFYESLKLEFEQGLVDSCMESAQGSIFLLKTLYRYREGQDINLVAGNEGAKKVVRSWGVDASADKESEVPCEGSEV
jgi:hypothetical protein